MKAALTTLAAAFALLGAASGAGANGGTVLAHAPIGGIVGHAATGRATQVLRALATSDGIGPLVYHNGPVMHTNTTYAIYWFPSGYTLEPGYKSTIDQYFEDVAAASGGASNVYSTDTQYYDNSGSIAYQSTFGASYVDLDPFPTTSGCQAAPTCLTDDQLQSEIGIVLARENWQASATNMFFLMTPNGVASCADSSNNTCSTNVFCAYHSAFYTNSGPVIYANEPYDAGIPGCQSPESPNGNAADSELNTISHEHNEAITDPYITAWYSDDGNQDEIGDLCAWTFGTVLGGAPGAEYNQVINGHDYWLQQEYSNASLGCVQQFSGVGLPGDLAPPVVSGTAAVGRALSTSNGTWTNFPTGYAYQWQRCDATGNNCTDIPGATGASYTLTPADADDTVRSEVGAINAAGTGSLVAATPSNVVVPLPATSQLPVVTGVPKVGKILSTSDGAWNTESTYAYQWLRCDARGASCVSIPGANSSTRKVAEADVGHTLEARVTATNDAGTTIATSNHTTVVTEVTAALHAPSVSGKAKIGKRLTAKPGSWSGSPTKFRYLWLRCSAHGSSCAKIARATHKTYRVGSRDAGHRLRVRVTASGSAGSATATSRPTARVRR